ncbi:MAG: HepT-like ribonuclease domain-containing protein [Pyrobaculum sp.]
MVTRSVAESMRRFVGLRNLIVHRYWEVDDERMYKELKEEGLRRVREYLESVAKYASVV